MKHPTKEQWMAYLYDEMSREKRSELNEHLKECADCRKYISGSQRLKGQLDTWQLRAAPKRRIVARDAIIWAAAAMFMALAAFGLGRFTASQPDIATIRAAIEPQLRQSFQQELKVAREADRKSYIAMLRDVEEQRLTDYTNLRKDLETVAVVADEKLSTTQQALSQLNLFAQSETTKDQSIK